MDVELRGQVSDVPAFLGEIDALVVPSVGNEGQPTSILEALAYGRPVVVRDGVYARDYEGLPVVAYSDSADLGAALRDLPQGAVDAAELERRFGPAQLIAAFEAASARS